MQAHERMMNRNLVQTPSSRMASVQAIGAMELLKLKKEKQRDPRARLVAVEESLRDILFSNYESEAATREPRHFQLVDSRHSTPEGYFGFLILLYGTRGAYDLCKELFQAATSVKEDNADYQAPISLLTAIMEAHYRAQAWNEVAECWELARAQAGKLAKTLNEIVNPHPATFEDDSLLDPAIKEQASVARIAQNRRQVLRQATRIYVRSLLSRKDIDGLPIAQRTIKDLMMNGFILDNLTFNEFIQMLARRGRLFRSEERRVGKECPV